MSTAERSLLQDQIHELLHQVPDHVLQQVLDILAHNASQDDLLPLTPDEQRRLERGLEDIRYGRTVPNDVVLADMEQIEADAL